MNKNIRICFMGTPHFGKNVLEKLNEEYNVVLVVTQPDKKGKRGELIESEVKKYALEHNLELFQPESIKDDYKKLEEYNLDFIITAAYGQFLPLNLLHIPHFPVLNVHGSLLPKYRGGAPIQRAIENGDEYLGVSVMRTILKMDAGSIYKQSQIKLEDTDTTESMMDKLSIKGREDLCEIIDKFYANEELNPIKQDEALATYSPNITKEEEFLDFNEDALTLFNKIRAFYPDPLTYFKKDGLSYKVYSSEVIKDNSDKLPGEIIENGKKLIIKCKNDALFIKEIQPQGKNRMDSLSFLNGKRNQFKLGDIVNED